MCELCAVKEVLLQEGLDLGIAVRKISLDPTVAVERVMAIAHTLYPNDSVKRFALGIIARNSFETNMGYSDYHPEDRDSIWKETLEDLREIAMHRNPMVALLAELMSTVEMASRKEVNLPQIVQVHRRVEVLTFPGRAGVLDC